MAVRATSVALLIFVCGLVTAGLITSAPRASASPANQAFCTAEAQFSTRWATANLDTPGVPFLNDGNADGIADALQIHRESIPKIAADLKALAAQAPAELQNALQTLAVNVKALSNDPVPANEAQSAQDTAAIDKVAPGIQKALKDCPDQNFNSNQAAPNDAPDPGTSSGSNTAGGSSGSNTAGGVEVIVFVLLNLPLIYEVWKHARKPRLNADATRFKGNLRRWKVETYTGTVLNVQTRTVMTTSGDGLVSPGGQISIRTTTQTTETITLDLTNGGPTPLAIVNFNAAPSKGDVVSVCAGRKRSKWVPFAVLNHTTSGSIVQPQAVFSLRAGGSARQIIVLFWMMFSGFVSILLAVFGGAGWLLAVYFGLITAFVIASRRAARMNMQPLWNRTKSETAGALR